MQIFYIMRKFSYKALAVPLLCCIFLGAAGKANAGEPPKQIRIYINIDKAAKNLGITSPQISGKSSISFLQKGIKPVFINEKESQRNDHLRVDVSAREKLVWITISYIKVFKFKFRGDYAYESGVVWSAERSGLTHAESKSYLEFIDILIESFLNEQYYLIRS